MLDFGKWLKVFDFKNLEGFFSSEKGKGGVGDALITVLVSNLIYQVPIMIISILSVMILGSAAGYSSSAALFGGSIIIASIVLFFISIILEIALFFIMNGTQHIIAGLLGGKGKYGDLLYLDSYIIAASNLVALVLGIIPAVLTLIPGVGTMASGLLSCVLLPIEIIVAIYMLYALYHVLKINYGLSSGRAIGTLALNIILWVIIVAILVLVLYAILIIPYLQSLGSLSSTY